MRKIQEDSGLNENQWRFVMQLFVNAGRISLARDFSSLSGKHDYRSDEYIDTLATQRPGKDVYCAELGCSEADMTGTKGKKSCFKELVRDLKGEVINSPASKIAYDKNEKEEAGIFYEEDEKKKGVFHYAGINHNIYAKHILNNYKLLIQESGKYYLYKNNCWKPISDMKLERILRFFFHKFEPGSWNTSLANRYMSVLRNECWDMDDVFPSENYINVKNGLLDLRDFTLKPHDSKIFTTNQIPVVCDTEKYSKDEKTDPKDKNGPKNKKTNSKDEKNDPTELCPAFMKFLDTIFADRKEKTKVKLTNFIQEMMGYCLSNSVKAHKFFFLVGDGSNGKSVLCDVLTELAGGVENVSNVALRNFSKQFALAQIMDKTLNISTENEIEGNLDTQTLKAIVSGEAMQIEEKFKMPISHRPTAKLIFAVNTLPKTNDSSFGFGRRVICIPFNIRFVEGKPKNDSEKEADPNLIDKLKGEKELAGIFEFAIAGLKRLKDRDYKFVIPKVVRKATEEYEAMNDLYLAFVRECVIAAPEANKEVTQQDLLETFQEWCAQEGWTKERNVATKPFMRKFRKAMKKAQIEFKEETHNNKEYPISEIRFSERGIELWEKTSRGRSSSRYRPVRTFEDLEDDDELQV
ncbi:MAG: DUF5906 domain-containing protein [Puniceicoccales bacterium]|nr:DUF5906 domain-containing protein [Puniceicoccales bacterium]